MEYSVIPVELITGLPEPSISLLYSNIIGITVLIGTEKYMFTGQPISLIARSEYFNSLFSKVDFRNTVVTLFEDKAVTEDLRAFTSLWNYLNGAVEIGMTFKGLNFVEVNKMISYLGMLKIQDKDFYNQFLNFYTGFSNYDSYDVSLMKANTPRLIIDLSSYFENDKILVGFWTDKLAGGLSVLEVPEPLASIKSSVTPQKVMTVSGPVLRSNGDLQCGINYLSGKR